MVCLRSRLICLTVSLRLTMLWNVIAFSLLWSEGGASAAWARNSCQTGKSILKHKHILLVNRRLPKLSHSSNVPHSFILGDNFTKKIFLDKINCVSCRRLCKISSSELSQETSRTYTHPLTFHLFWWNIRLLTIAISSAIIRRLSSSKIIKL